jgi:hypothetical protein
MVVLGVDGATTGIVSAKPLTADPQKYCISAQDGGHWADVKGPGGTVTMEPDTVSADPCAGL